MRHLWKVRPEDFNVETLMAAAREGRLYIDETDNETALAQQLEQRQHEALAYVSTLPDFDSFREVNF